MVAVSRQGMHTLISEIFAGRNFRESAHSRNFLHFAGIYFRELSCLKKFAGMNFREWENKKFFLGNLISRFEGKFAKIAKFSSRENF